VDVNRDHVGVSIRAETEENHAICPLCKLVIYNEAFDNALTAILTGLWRRMNCETLRELNVMFEGGGRGLFEDTQYFHVKTE